MAKKAGIPRIEKLVVKNFRALRDVTLADLTPLTVLTGPNGSGKSTVFDVFAFLSEAFTNGLRPALDARNRLAEVRSRGTDGPVVIEFRYRDVDGTPLTYHLEIGESDRRPVVEREWLSLPRRARGRPPYVIDFRSGSGVVLEGESPGELSESKTEQLQSSDLLAVSALGQFERHPRISALRTFITGWYLSYVAADGTRTTPNAGPEPRLSRTGDNLPNVVQYLIEEHPDRFEEIRRVLIQRIPRLETIEAETLADNRLLLRVKDGPFTEPVLSRYASDGTLKLLAYLTVLYDPTPAPFIGIEEPENQLHPRLLALLAEECRGAAARSQLLVTTHSPEFLNELRPEEVRVLYRATDGYTRVADVAAMASVMAQVEAGAKLGALWRQGYFEHGDPLAQSRDDR
jgi:predicted ATPase